MYETSSKCVFLPALLQHILNSGVLLRNGFWCCYFLKLETTVFTKSNMLCSAHTEPMDLPKEQQNILFASWRGGLFTCRSIVVSPCKDVIIKTQQEQSSVYTVKDECKEYGACFLKLILQAFLFCIWPWVHNHSGSQCHHL